MRKAADISSPNHYEHADIRFSYPRNWSVTEDVVQEDVRYLFVEGPGDAILIIQMYAISDVFRFNEFVEWFSSQAKENIPFGKIVDGDFVAIKTTHSNLNAKAVKEDFSIELLG